MTTRSERRRLTNLALGVLLVLAVVSGLLTNTIGVRWSVAPAAVHGAIAIAVVVLAPWKSPIVRRGLAHRRRDRSVSLALLVLVLATVASGLAHSTGLVSRVGPLTIMQIHVGGGLMALVPAAWHFRARPARPRPTDLSRRTALLGLGAAGASVAVRAGWEGLLDAVGAPGGDRRFTGSHERGSFDPEVMPVTQWLDDRVQRIDPDDWALEVDGRTWHYSELMALPHDTVTAVLDCTSGWFSRQRWSGVRLDRLVPPTDARSIVVRSATGYSRRLPITDLQRSWLATEIGGEALSAGHGFPARLVVPDRRGFWWVKWVTHIETSARPAWVQLPFPAT